MTQKQKMLFRPTSDRFDTYPRSIACTAIVWLFTIGTIGVIGLLAIGA